MNIWGGEDWVEKPRTIYRRDQGHAPEGKFGIYRVRKRDFSPSGTSFLTDLPSWNLIFAITWNTHDNTDYEARMYSCLSHAPSLNISPDLHFLPVRFWRQLWGGANALLAPVAMPLDTYAVTNNLYEKFCGFSRVLRHSNQWERSISSLGHVSSIFSAGLKGFWHENSWAKTMDLNLKSKCYNLPSDLSCLRQKT